MKLWARWRAPSRPITDVGAPNSLKLFGRVIATRHAGSISIDLHSPGGTSLAARVASQVFQW